MKEVLLKFPKTHFRQSITLYMEEVSHYMISIIKRMACFAISTLLDIAMMAKYYVHNNMVASNYIKINFPKVITDFFLSYFQS